MPWHIGSGMPQPQSQAMSRYAAAGQVQPVGGGAHWVGSADSIVLPQTPSPPHSRHRTQLVASAVRQSTSGTVQPQSQVPSP